MWMYLAEDLIKSQRNLDSDEFLEINPFSTKEAYNMVKSGQIEDVNTIFGILWYYKLKNKM